MPAERSNANATNQGPVPYNRDQRHRPAMSVNNASHQARMANQRQEQLNEIAAEMGRPYRTDQRGRVHLTNQRDLDIIVPCIPARLTTEEHAAIAAEGAEQCNRAAIRAQRNAERQRVRAEREAAQLLEIAERLRRQAEEREAAEKEEHKRQALEDYNLYGKGRFTEAERLKRVQNKVVVQFWDVAIRNTLPIWADWRDITCSAVQWQACINEWPLLAQTTRVIDRIGKTAKARHATCDPQSYRTMMVTFEEIEIAILSWKRCCLESKTTNAERRRFLVDMKRLTYGTLQKYDIDMEIELIVNHIAKMKIHLPAIWCWEDSDNNTVEAER
ncbi:hypothetical protein WOLCODRAFT_158864 [Wolfiporia cocos MD-104 SS10]|uniref:Uncharacterized protein n=1 Tax=Wolfiporia cocos (strain MD-104) TaxID=742152 RepID=A0A2H3JAL7_WOLCO|nr:hypothetical protein WOLCODRAFT_158864 [Wolfiporia cocos MD-104 SS10]